MSGPVIVVEDEVVRTVEISEEEIQLTVVDEHPVLEIQEFAAPGATGATGAVGPEGPPGTGGTSDVEYVHSQGVPSSTWTITHGLGKYPSVTVVDISDVEIEAELQYVDQNQVLVLFSTGTAGQAFLN